MFRFDQYANLLPNKSPDDVVELLWQAVKSDIDTMSASFSKRSVNSERDAMILKERLSPGNSTKRRCTLRELGRRFGISGERIRQLEIKGLRRLKHSSHYTKGVFRTQLHAFMSEIGAENYRLQGAWLIGVLSHRPCEQLFVDYVASAFLRDSLLPKKKHKKFKQALEATMQFKRRRR